MIHLPNLFEKSRPPRALVTKRDLGKTFSNHADQVEEQQQALFALLELAYYGELEEFRIYND